MTEGKSSAAGGGPPVSLEMGVIGNCSIGALVDVRARIVWYCMPRLDGDPVFQALLDSPDGVGHDGVFAIELEGITHSEQAYDTSTAVLRTRLFDAAGQGNFPQTYSIVGIINGAMRLSRRRDDLV
jgi:hypothetical protein